MKWVTREHPRTDRVACPWLIRKFIDADAEIVYVPSGEVLAYAEREGATSFDAPGAKYTHRGSKCTFETLIEAYEIDDPAIAILCQGCPRRGRVRGPRRDTRVPGPAGDRRWIRDARRR